ncbi:MAG: DUF5696 domain-containing protein [Verrucomicrobia bacterium]|nr:DUF5696 domain-containing protein [Verrucomicrobiota bacterium]
MILLIWQMAVNAACGQEQWTFERPYVWARDTDTAVLEQQDTVLVVKHQGSGDWSLGGFARIPVQPGEIFETVCKMMTESRDETATASTGVVVRDDKGKELDWSYGGTSVHAPCEWSVMKSRFVVPGNAASIEPLVIGQGPVAVRVDGYVVKRVGSMRDRIQANLPQEMTLDGKGIRFTVNCADASVAVTDQRTGRVWAQADGISGWVLLNAVAAPDQQSLALTLLNPETVSEVRAVFTVSTEAPELGVEISAAGELTKPLDFPRPFATRAGDRLIVPVNEGMGYPVNEPHAGLYRMVAYGGHGICMGFFGVAEDKTGAGWMCLLETPDDAAMNAYRDHHGWWLAGPSWDAQKGRFGYPRKARYVFFDRGGHVAMCKRYQAHAKRCGLYIPFAEKLKRNPNIDLLIGAANIWRLGGGTADPVELAKEMQQLGMDRLLWSAGGSASEIKGLRALPKVLVGRYDIYQDIMDPANHDKIGYVHGDWVTAAFPHDLNWSAPNGSWRRGWEVKAKDGAMIPCAVICDSKALPYARKRIADELATKAYSARFIDTTVAAPWFECYHPDHPMSRSQSRQYKMDLLKLVVESGLVCGSETGHEASVPFCDYFEGMLSVGPYRVPDSGRDMLRIWHEVPELLTKYQVGEAYRLPLWELVYHDCVVAQWYWGDYNNKLPQIWHKRDLFNALYGTPPMYLFDIKQWHEKKAQFAASYKIAQPVSRATGYSAMIDHRILTPDRKVQQTVFANGVTVTVNFGDTPFKTADGPEIPASDVQIKGMN